MTMDAERTQEDSARNTMHSGGLNQLADPAFIADRLRRENIRLRSECLAVAAGLPFSDASQVLKNAKDFFDFITKDGPAAE